MDKILVFDFGSQTTQLIARRIREAGVYSEITAGDSPVTEDLLQDVRGIILSGSPESVNQAGSPQPDPRVFECGLPVLGICYGFQIMTKMNGGRVASLEKREYGRSTITFQCENPLFNDVPDGFVSWMSHGDSIELPAAEFEVTAKSEHHIAAAYHAGKQLYGIQFHPEVTHCEYGIRILENFVFGICGMQKNWNMQRFMVEIESDIRESVGDRKVLLLISGGVDSTVLAALLLHCLNTEQVYLMYIDTGLMRKNETQQVVAALERLGATHLFAISAGREFLDALAGVDEPEKKRTIIGDLFVRIQQREIKAQLGSDYILAQGTLYTDMIESGKGVGKNAHTIKSHHNVKTPLIEEKRARNELIEPLALLYKDEVRHLGELLHLDQAVVGRHPFPGPGLAVRILGEVTEAKCAILREADAIFIAELRRRKLYDEIWQAFCVLLPIRSVGVAGDAREYGYVLSLRAIISRDGMTADVYPFDMKALLEISSLIVNSVPAVGRVVYDVTSKPPATIEWE